MVMTNTHRIDGFGGQYQNIIYCYAFAELRNCPFYYRPITSMEHNYFNENDFIERKELLMGFKKNLPIYTFQKTRNISRESIFLYIEKNLDRFSKTNALKNAKNFFYEGKSRQDYVDEKFFNVAIHVRRALKDDNREVKDCDHWVNKIMDVLRRIEFHKPLKFHIISVGEIENFKKVFSDQDITHHLDNPVEKDFCTMVYSDILVTSPDSSLSYVAALISDNSVLYLPFYSPPLPLNNWVNLTEKVLNSNDSKLEQLIRNRLGYLDSKKDSSKNNTKHYPSRFTRR
jgi:hypothetical protein